MAFFLCRAPTVRVCSGAALLRSMTRQTCMHIRLCSTLEGAYVEKTPITRQLWRKRQEHQAQELLLQTTDYRVNSSSERVIIDKPAAHSRVDVNYEFKTDMSLRNIYTDSFKRLMPAKLLEDLDALAGSVGFLHADDGLPDTSPLTLVTASIERIKLFRDISVEEDLVLSGQVVYVGKSSMDVLVEAHQYPTDIPTGKSPPLADPVANDTRVLSSLFTYVARDKETGKSAPVNRLERVGMTRTETALWEERAAIIAARKEARNRSGANSSSSSKSGATVARTEDTEAEIRKTMISMVDHGKAISDMPALAPPGQVLMGSTVMEHSFVCQPQSANTGGNVFGGFLLHEACALAQSTIYLYSGQQPRLSLVDKIFFQRPVHIGDLIRLRSRVAYVSNEMPMKRAVVNITCHVISPDTFTAALSNRFSFSYELEPSSRLKDVQPSTKEEVISMMDSAHGVLGLDKDVVFEHYKK